MSYDALGEERKKLQEQGLIPEWMTTAGWQLFKDKYLSAPTVKDQYERIANTLAKHTDDPKGWSEKFFNLLWKGWLSPSTPVLANTGTNRGLPVSCSGQYVEDSVDGFYTARRESALLTKHGFGTSAYLGDIRSRGTPISVGGKASGILPVLKGFVQDSREVSQGGTRRGAWAGYIPIEHGDFWEIIRFLEKEPDDVNVGWNVSDNFVEKLEGGDGESIARYQEALKVKMVTGKGYFFFTDKANRALPSYYPLPHKASNLCSEILLPSDREHTYTCVLSSLNLARYDEWKDTDAVFDSTVFLDCVASEFIEKAKDIPGLENAVRFTQKARALGLGVCGFHSYLQQQGWAFEGLPAYLWNAQVFKYIRGEADRATSWMAEAWGTPEWSDGSVRNCSLLAVAPTKSTALIMGGISEGINPDPAMVYMQATAGGEVERINPCLLNLMKEKSVYNKRTVQSISDAYGSVQHVDWLTDEEKQVFRTAFEIDQMVALRLADARGKYLDQWQSLNLFFSAEEDPAYISRVHREAFVNPNILGLYYVYSKSGVSGSKDECLSCQ